MSVTPPTLLFIGTPPNKTQAPLGGHSVTQYRLTVTPEMARAAAVSPSRCAAVVTAARTGRSLRFVTVTAAVECAAAASAGRSLTRSRHHDPSPGTKRPGRADNRHDDRAATPVDRD